MYESLQKKPNFRTTFRNQKGNIKTKKKKCQIWFTLNVSIKCVSIWSCRWFLFSKTYIHKTSDKGTIEIYIKKSKSKKQPEIINDTVYMMYERSNIFIEIVSFRLSCNIKKKNYWKKSSAWTQLPLLMVIVK